MNVKSLNTFPQLTTKRLKLRRLLMSDSEDVFMLRTDKEVNTFIERPASRTDNNGKEFVIKTHKSIVENNIFYWVISLQENSKLIGTICLWNFNKNRTVAEVGYELYPQFQGQGIMTEALNGIVKYGFNALILKAIEAFTHKDNIASIRLLLKNGFEKESIRIDKENISNIIFIKQND